MKRAYTVKTRIGEGWPIETFEYLVIAASVERAAKIALRQSIEDSGQKTSDGQRWRVVSLVERGEKVIP